MDRSLLLDPDRPLEHGCQCALILDDEVIALGELTTKHPAKAKQLRVRGAGGQRFRWEHGLVVRAVAQYQPV